jgi:hypothetical protein
MDQDDFDSSVLAAVSEIKIWKKCAGTHDFLKKSY